MASYQIAVLIGLLASLFLAMRGLRSHGFSFENKAWMAVAWLLLIVGLAFIIGRMGL